MWPVIIGAAVGAWFVGRGKPNTKFRKLQIVGPTTGTIYEAEDVPEAGLIIVRGPGPSSASFLRKPRGGFVFYKGEGHEDGIMRIISDVAPHMLKGISS